MHGTLTVKPFLKGNSHLFISWFHIASHFFFSYFPKHGIFNHLAGFFPNFSIPISALNPRLNPGPQWGISIIPGLLYDFLLKLPLIISDSIVTVLLFKIVRSKWQNEKAAVLVAALWFFNPIVIWVSSGWGMFDSLPTLFTVLSLYFVLNGKYSYSFLSLLLSTLLKFYAIVIFIPLLVIVWKKAGPRAALVSLIPTAAIAFLASLPLFLISNSLSFVSATPSEVSQYAGLSIWTSLWLTGSPPEFSVISDVLVIVGLCVTYFFILRYRSVIQDDLTVLSVLS